MNNLIFAKNRMLKGITTFVVITAFLWQNLVWADGNNIFTINFAREKTAGRIYSGFDFERKELPYGLGTIQDAWSTLPKYNFNQRGLNTVIHIQDAHCNYYAQRKIAEIIAYFNNIYGIDVINLEGGEGEYDLSTFTDIENEAIRKTVADSMAKKGKLSAAELYSVLNPGRINLWGVENARLYINNLDIYRNIAGKKEAIDKLFDKLDSLLNGLKPHIFNKELRNFEAERALFKKGDIELKEYIDFCVQNARDLGVKLNPYAEIKRLCETIGIEGRINFEEAEKERQKIIDLFNRDLSKIEKEELIIKVLKFKKKQLSQKQFYEYLIYKARCLGINLKKFPNLHKYNRYVSVYDALDQTKLFEEIEVLEKDLCEMFCKTFEQKQLVNLSRNFEHMKDMLSMKFTKRQYDRYKKNKEDYDARRFISFINENISRSQVNAEIDENLISLNSYIQNMEKFYDYSFKRDKAFIENIKFGAHSPINERRNPETEVLGSLGGRSAILVTGGFHTENICKIMRERGISYISIMPKFDSPKGYENDYLRLLTGGHPKEYKDIAQALGMSMIAVAGINSPLGGKAYGETQNIMEKLRLSMEIARIKEQVRGGRHGVKIVCGDKARYFDTDWKEIKEDEVEGTQTFETIVLSEPEEKLINKNVHKIKSPAVSDKPKTSFSSGGNFLKKALRYIWSRLNRKIIFVFFLAILKLCLLDISGLRAEVPESLIPGDPTEISMVADGLTSWQQIPWWQELYQSGNTKRIKEDNGIITEYMDENWEEYGFGRVLSRYNPGYKEYKIYEWKDTEVIVREYAVENPDDVYTGRIKSKNPRREYVYKHNGQQTNINTDTNGWTQLSVTPLFDISEEESPKPADPPFVGPKPIEISTKNFKIMSWQNDDHIYTRTTVKDFEAFPNDSAGGKNLSGYSFRFTFEDGSEGTSMQIFLKNTNYENVYSSLQYLGSDNVMEFDPCLDSRNVDDFWHISNIHEIGIKVWNRDAEEVLSKLKKVELVPAVRSISPEKFKIMETAEDHIYINTRDEDFECFKKITGALDFGRDLRGYKIKFTFEDGLSGTKIKINYIFEKSRSLMVSSKACSVIDNSVEFDPGLEDVLNGVPNVVQISVKIWNQDAGVVLSKLKKVELIRQPPGKKGLSLSIGDGGNERLEPGKDSDAEEVKVYYKEKNFYKRFYYYFLALIGAVGLIFSILFKIDRRKNKENILRLLQDFQRDPRIKEPNVWPLLAEFKDKFETYEKRRLINRTKKALEYVNKGYLFIRNIVTSYVVFIATMNATALVLFIMVFSVQSIQNVNIYGLIVSVPVIILCTSAAFFLIDLIYMKVIKRFVLPRLEKRRKLSLNSLFLNLIEVCDRKYSALIRTVLNPKYIKPLIMDTDKKNRRFALILLTSLIKDHVLETAEDAEKYHKMLLKLNQLGKYSSKDYQVKEEIFGRTDYSAYELFKIICVENKRILRQALDSGLLELIVLKSGKNIHNVLDTLNVLINYILVIPDNIKAVKRLLEIVLAQNEKDMLNLLEALRAIFAFSPVEWRTQESFVEKITHILESDAHKVIEEKIRQKTMRMDCYEIFFLWAVTGLMTKDNVQKVDWQKFTPPLKVEFKCLIIKIFQEKRDMVPLILDPGFIMTLIDNAGDKPGYAILLLNEMVSRGIIDKTNFEQYQKLVSDIASKESRRKRWLHFRQINRLIEGFSITAPVLNIDFFITLIENAGKDSIDAFSAFGGLHRKIGRDFSLQEFNAIVEGVRVARLITKDEKAVGEYILFLADQPSLDFITNMKKFLREKRKIRIENDEELFLCQVPKKIREKVKAKGLDKIKWEINKQNYSKKPYLIYLFLMIKMHIPKTEGMGLEEFENIITKKDEKSQYADNVNNYITKNILEEDLELGDKEQKHIMNMSIDLKEEVEKLLKEFAADFSAPITFRELVRYNVDFSNFYLWQREGAKKGTATLENVIEVFILTAYNVYGRFLYNEDIREKFIAKLIKCLESHPELVDAAAMYLTAAGKTNWREFVKNIMDYSDYENLGRKPGKNEMPLKVKFRALVNRARQVKSSLMLFLNDNSVFLNEVLQDMNEEEDTEVISLSMSEFTKRQELFGMYMPQEHLSEDQIQKRLERAKLPKIKEALDQVLGIDKDRVRLKKRYKEADEEEKRELRAALEALDEESKKYFEMWESPESDLWKDAALNWALAVYLKHGRKWREFFKWRQGILQKMSDKARNNTQKKYYLVFENIEACPHKTRVLLNPVLWEKMVEIPEQGETVTIPPNLNFIFTMHKDSEIHDPSFMDRHLVHYAPTPGVDDIEQYLINRTGITDNTAKELIKIKKRFEKMKLKKPVRLSFIDLMEIAKRIKGVFGEKAESQDDVFNEEVYQYLYLRLRCKQDREKLVSILKGVPGAGFQAPDIKVIGDRIFFGNVGIEMSEKFKQEVSESKGKSPEDLLLEFYEFDVSDLERRIFAQIARSYKYGGKVLQLEGPSGDGKTEIGKVFSQLIGFSLREKTVNADTNRSEICGQIQSTKEGNYRLYQPEYMEQIRNGRNVFLFNEINTSQNSALYYWLFPEIADKKFKYLSEFALTDDTIAKEIRINRNNLWLFTVNPKNKSFKNRGITPPRIVSHIPVFYMAMEEEQIPGIVNKLFVKKELDKHERLEHYKVYEDILSNVHTAFRRAREKDAFLSNQDVTRRKLINAADKFKEYLKKGDLSPPQALRYSLDLMYVYMWRDITDKRTARGILQEILKDTILKKTKEIDIRELVNSVFKNEKRPVLLFDDAVTDISGFDDAIRKEAGDNGYTKTEFHEVVLSFFHRKRQLLGGFVPPAERKKEKRDKRIAKLSARFEIGLGIIPYLIQEARLDPGALHVMRFHDYTELNPQVAPLLNEFLQTGRLTTLEDYITPRLWDGLKGKINNEWNRLRKEYQDKTGNEIKAGLDDIDPEIGLRFAKWFYSNAPENLKIVAIGSSFQDTDLTPAEIDRFLPVNISKGMSKKWITLYIGQIMGKTSPYRKLDLFQKEILNVIYEAYSMYEKQRGKEYHHNRLGKKDIDSFLDELSRLADKGELTEDKLNETAFYILGAGLREESREKLSYTIKDPVLFGDMQGKTSLACTRNLIIQLNSMLLAFRAGRPVIFEGEPGGGKTAACEEFAKIMNLPFYKMPMYEDIDLGDFLGRLAKKGQDFIFTCKETDAKGSFILKFLKAYKEGGVFLLDEGAMGENAQSVINYIMEVSQMKVLDLGTFNPGLNKDDRYITKSDDFCLVVTQNPADTTYGRKPISYKADTLSCKVWVDNFLSKNDITKIMDHYLDDKKDDLPPYIKKKIVAIHTFFSRRHPYKEELSPRQLIKMIKILKNALIADEDKKGMMRALFIGIMTSYMSRLSGDDFKELWPCVRKLLGASDAEGFLEEWKADISIRKENDSIAFDGIKIPVSFGVRNVRKEDIFLSETLSSQNTVLRQMALGIHFKEAIDLMEEDGADAVDIVRKFAYLTGYELDILWSHPHMTKIQILNSVLPKFETKFNEYGIKKQDISEEFIKAMGFLMRHLKTEEEYKKEKDKLHVQNILFFNMMDAIPERQRVVLNEILTTRKISLTDADYILPEWVHIVVSSSVEHKFASAFMNRFMPIRVKSLLNFSDSEIKSVIQRRYPLIRDEEAAWMWTITKAVSEFDKSRNFETGYGYSGLDLLKMARMVQLEKQRDIEDKKYDKRPFTRLYYVLKAAYIMYELGLERKDVAVFKEKILRKWIHRITAGKYPEKIIDFMIAKVKENIDRDLDVLKPVTHSITLAAPELQGAGKTLDNGITVRKTQNGVVVKTPDNVYDIDESEHDLNNWFELSGGFRIKKDGEDLLMELDFIGTVGEIAIPRDKFNLERSITENEVPTKKFIRYTSSIKRCVASLLRAWQRVEDNTGRIHLPRAAFIMGETGTAKTTLVRNLAEVMGVPLYTLNAYEDLKTSSFTVGFGVKEDKFELGIKEFLARCGKINGERKIVPSKVTSSRSILLIDEANACPELFWALLPVFRGERKFTIEYAGESIEVELDKEIMLAFTFNPAERYSGRGQIPREVSAYAEKLWAPNPLDQPREVLISILSEYYRRGITRHGKEISDKMQGKTVSRRGKYVPVKPAKVKVKDLKETFAGDITESIDAELASLGQELAEFESTGKKPERKPQKTKTRQPVAPKTTSGKIESNKPKEEKIKQKPPKQKPKKKIVKLKYSPFDIIRNAKKLIRTLEQKDIQNKNKTGFPGKEYDQQYYLFFIYGILKGYLIALGSGDMNDELKNAVLAAADKLDKEVGEKLREIITLFAESLSSGEKISRVSLRERMFDLRRLFVRKKQIFMFIFPRGRRDQVYLEIFAEKIQRTLDFESKDFQKLGICPEIIEEYQKEGIKALFVSKKHYPNKSKGGHFEGEFAIAFEEKYSLKHISNWAGWHELGHMIDQLRARNKKDGFEMPRNIELNAMLFPAVFSPVAREYIMTNLVSILTIVRDPEDYYCQAAKGILNGFILYSGRKIPLITDKFELGSIFSVSKYISGLRSAEINNIAEELYKNRGKYLSTTGDGRYRNRDAQQEMTMGVDGDVNTMEEGPREEEEVEVEKDDKEEPRLKDDMPSKPEDKSQEGAEVAGEEKGEEMHKDEDDPDKPGEFTDQKVTDEDFSDNKVIIDIPETAVDIAKKLPGISPKLVEEWFQIFTEEHSRSTSSDSGDEWDPENMFISLEPFLEKIVRRTPPSVDCGITVDVSYSTQAGLLKIFTEMARYYSALFYSAARKNKDIDFYINAIGKKFFSLLDAKGCRDKETIEKCLNRLSKMCNYPGINTPALIEGLRKKYSGRKRKQYGIEVVFTDGIEESFAKNYFKKLNKDLEALEEELGIHIVFIGIGKDAKKVCRYYRHIWLKEERPTASKLMQIIMDLSRLEVQGKLSHGDLSVPLGLKSPDELYISKKTAVDKDSADKGIIRDKEGRVKAIRIIKNLEEMKKGRRKQTEEIRVSEESYELDEIKDSLIEYVKDTVNSNADVMGEAEIEKRRNILINFLSMLEHSPPQFFTFEKLVRDFFGYADIDNNFISLNSYVKNNKVAFFHELGHLLINKKEADNFPLLDLELKDDTLTIKFKNTSTPFMLKLSEKTKTFILKEEMQSWPQDWRQKEHYLLRVFAREFFGEKDEELSLIIQTKQELKARVEKISASLTNVMRCIRFPKEKTVILMPKSQNPVLEKEIMEDWQVVRNSIWREYKMGNIIVRFYDAENEDAVFLKTGKDIEKDKSTYALVYAMENQYARVKSQIEGLDRIYCVRERVDKEEIILTMIGTHIILALGLIDLLRNNYEYDEHKNALIDNLSKLLFDLTLDEEICKEFKKDWHSIFGGFTLEIKPFSEELEENLLAVEEVAKSL